MGFTTVDDLLANFGDPGRYQKSVFAMLIYAMSILSLNNMLTIFNMGSSPHHCKVPDGISLNYSIPRLENGEFDSCSMYVNFSDHNAGITDCINGWTHYSQDGKWTIVQEWDLVCDKHYRAALANSLYFFGVTIGCGLFGYLADKIGRRPVILTCLYTYVAIGISIAFVQDYNLYVALRILGGIVVQGASGTSYTMSIELFLTHRRNALAVLTQIQWPIMLLMLTILDYYIKSWRIFQLIISVPFVLTFVYVWFLPECPRWLIAMNKVNRAKIELKRFARYNYLPVPPNLGSEITHLIECNRESESVVDKRYGFLDLFRTKRMFSISFAGCFHFFANCFAFYAVSYSMTSIGSDFHISYVITSLIDTCVIVLSYFVLHRTTRKTLCYSTILFNTSISVLVVILLILLPAKNAATLLGITIIAGIGRAGIAAYFVVMPIYVSEMSPTVIRSLVLGVSNLWGRIGGIIAPQVMLLEKYVWKPLPFVLCACMTFTCFLITLRLPETKNKQLPEVPEDVEKLWDDAKKSSSDQEIMKPIVSDSKNCIT